MTTHAVDESGRITLKKQQRELLGGEVYLTYGDSTSIRMFTPEAFDEFEASIMQMWDGTYLDPDWDFIQRTLLDCRVACKIDGQGRLRIPAAFIAHAGLAVDADSEIQVIYRARFGFWEIWPSDDLGKAADDTDAVYRARRLLSDRMREQRDAKLAEGTHNA